MATLTINFTNPGTPPVDGFIVKYRKVGTTSYTQLIPNPTASPIIITVPERATYEGIVQADCGSGESSGSSFTATPETQYVWGKIGFENNVDPISGSTARVGNIVCRTYLGTATAPDLSKPINYTKNNINAIYTLAWNNTNRPFTFNMNNQNNVTITDIPNSTSFAFYQYNPVKYYSTFITLPSACNVLFTNNSDTILLETI